MWRFSIFLLNKHFGSWRICWRGKAGRVDSWIHVGANANIRQLHLSLAPAMVYGSKAMELADSMELLHALLDGAWFDSGLEDVSKDILRYDSVCAEWQ